jgi:hypothetical protein
MPRDGVPARPTRSSNEEDFRLVTGIVNVTFHAVHAATVSWSMLPLGFYAFGMSLATLQPCPSARPG